MENLNYLNLEREIVTELGPSATTTKKNQPVVVRRETVLAMLSRTAQTSSDFSELLNEAALLTASALEMEFFGQAQVQRAGSLTVGWDSVAENNRNSDPVLADVFWDSSRSAFAYALEAGHPILLGDIVAETRFVDPQLVAQNIQGGAICPIIYRDQRYGAIGVFSGNQRVLTKDEVLFLQSVTLMLGPTRAHQKTERALAEQSNFLSTAIDTLDAIVILIDAGGALVQINRACQIWGGFTTEQLRGRKLWSAFLLPGDEATIQSLIHDAGNRVGQRKCETFFLAKDGERRRISWTAARLPNRSNEAAFLLTGIDISDQYRTMMRLEEIEANVAAAARIDSNETSACSPCDAEKAGRERRRHDRRPYSCVQSIAPCKEGKLPARQDFIEVRCHDISPRGFSFLLGNKPDFEELVVAFGTAPSQLFLRARVKHTSSIQKDGRNWLKVGCEYLGRVRLPWIANVGQAS